MLRYNSLLVLQTYAAQIRQPSGGLSLKDCEGITRFHQQGGGILAIAAERTRDDAGHTLGRVIAQSTFHHFVDYNWDIDKGCPSFVEEPPGTEVKDDPSGLQDIYAYVKNVALWLAPTAI
jgi:hypothetical protein